VFEWVEIFLESRIERRATQDSTIEEGFIALTARDGEEVPHFVRNDGGAISAHGQTSMWALGKPHP
jgi:hypothetical protein